MAAAGETLEHIAVQLQMPVKRLQKRFRQDLEQGEAEGKHEVLTRLHESAKSGSSTTASIFWAKARCGWRDSGRSDNPAMDWPDLVITCQENA
jgi:hypothetical protein